MKKLTATLLTILLIIPVTWAQERAIKPAQEPSESNTETLHYLPH